MDLVRCFFFSRLSSFSRVSVCSSLILVSSVTLVEVMLVVLVMIYDVSVVLGPGGGECRYGYMGLLLCCVCVRCVCGFL